MVMRFWLGFLILLSGTSAALAVDPGTAVEQAHAEIWRRFVDRHGVLVDFTDLDGTIQLPTPEECREGKPNALGWFQPIENGAMFNGLYLDGALNRWKATKSDDDAAKARRLMEGLLLLNSISDVPGFVGRGVSTDGRSHFPMGSNDQTMPWYFGLWRYLESGLATPEERERIIRHLTTTTTAIIASGWKMPAEAPFGFRGGFNGYTFESAPRQLFVLQLMHRITGESRWQTDYLESLTQRGGEGNRSRLEICQAGMVFDYARTHNWTSCVSVSALRGLWEMESDPERRAAFAEGLRKSALLAAESLPDGVKFQADDGTTFSQDWRSAMMPLWVPQKTEHEASDLAIRQLREFVKISTRRHGETSFIREPVSAAWIVTLCPDRSVVEEHRPAIQQMIAYLDYRGLYYSTFFWVECAWWRLQ